MGNAGTVSPTVRVQREDFDLQAEIADLSAGRHEIGAVVTFSGLCRDEGGSLEALELEHYPGMAEAEMLRIASIAIAMAFLPLRLTSYMASSAACRSWRRVAPWRG